VQAAIELQFFTFDFLLLTCSLLTSPASLFALVSIHYRKGIISKGLAALELTAASPLPMYVSLLLYGFQGRETRWRRKFSKVKHLPSSLRSSAKFFAFSAILITQMALSVTEKLKFSADLSMPGDFVWG
jgi:hypothetical protein